MNYRKKNLHVYFVYFAIILCQRCVLQNLGKNKDIVITKPDKGNGVAILDQKLYDNAIQEIILDTFKFEKLNFHL